MTDTLTKCILKLGLVFRSRLAISNTCRSYRKPIKCFNFSMGILYAEFVYIVWVLRHLTAKYCHG